MKVAVLQHVESEGSGTLGEYLDSVGIEVRCFRLFQGDSLPTDLKSLDAVVSMGGPMNVYEEKTYPFLHRETEFLRSALSAHIPILGICLGAQMIAKACGAHVRRAPEEKIGWSTVTLTDPALQDPLFSGLSRILPVFQWHGDTFDLPGGARLLATSKACKHQAFRSGSAVGVQFHIEVTRSMIEEWFADRPDRDRMIAQYVSIESEFIRQAHILYGNLYSILKRRSV